MNDKIKKYGKSLIQHGKNSDRVYLLKLSMDDFPKILDQIYELAKTNEYSKIFAKVPDWAKDEFALNNYETEAYIPNFYKGKEDAFFMAKYLDPLRKEEPHLELIEEIIDVTKNTQPVTDLKLKDNYEFEILGPKDVLEMVSVYEKVFKTYPFPIHNPDYLAETMQENIVYFGVRDKGTLVALSSCEMDEQSKNVEMTDFATLPEYRAQGLASFLLAEMENEMKNRGIMTAYTIARAVSYGINITFAKHKYIFAGTLINNTNISGGIESMNIWYKPL
jgi:putative beta-lysine N-acetyltransferase